MWRQSGISEVAELTRNMNCTSPSTTDALLPRTSVLSHHPSVFAFLRPNKPAECSRSFYSFHIPTWFEIYMLSIFLYSLRNHFTISHSFTSHKIFTVFWGCEISQIFYSSFISSIKIILYLIEVRIPKEFFTSLYRNQRNNRNSLRNTWMD